MLADNVLDEFFVIDGLATSFADGTTADLHPLGPAGVSGEGVERLIDACLRALVFGIGGEEVAFRQAVALEGANTERVDVGVDGGPVGLWRNRVAAAGGEQDRQPGGLDKGRLIASMR